MTKYNQYFFNIYKIIINIVSVHDKIKKIIPDKRNF